MNKEFIAHIVKLLSSRVVMQVIIMLTAPIIARLFSPSQFGVFQIFHSIFMICSVFVGLQYERSIPLGDTPLEARASVVLSLFFTGIFTICSIFAVWMSRAALSEWFHAPDLADFLWLLPGYLFIFGIGNTLNYFAAREERFGTMGWASIGQQICDGGMTIAIGFLKQTSAIGLFLGRFVGLCVHMAILLTALGPKTFSHRRVMRLSLRELLRVSRQHRKFPMFNTWAQLLTIFSAQLPSLFFGFFFSPDIVGYYSLASRVGTLPITLLGQAIGQVFYPAAARLYRETGTLTPIVKDAVVRIVQLAVFPMSVLCLFGASLFQVVFGQQWSEAGVYAQILSGWYLMSFFNIPLDIFALMNRQDIGLIFTALHFVGRVLALFIGVSLGLPRVTLGLFVLSSVILLGGQLYYKLRLSQVAGSWAFNILTTYLALSCMLLLPVKGISWFFNDLSIEIVCLCFASGGYIVGLLVLEPSLRELAWKAVERLSGNTDVP